MATAAPPVPLTSTIATAAGGQAGQRCATCKKPIRDLDPIVTLPRALRPSHFGCAPKATQETLIAPAGADRCWYGDDISGQCPSAAFAANVCKSHHRELYGAATHARRGRAS